MKLTKFSVLFTNGNGLADVQGLWTDHTAAQVIAQMIGGRVIAVDIEVPDAATSTTVVAGNQIGKATRAAAKNKVTTRTK